MRARRTVCDTSSTSAHDARLGLGRHSNSHNRCHLLIDLHYHHCIIHKFHLFVAASSFLAAIRVADRIVTHELRLFKRTLFLIVFSFTSYFKTTWAFIKAGTSMLKRGCVSCSISREKVACEWNIRGHATLPPSPSPHARSRSSRCS